MSETVRIEIEFEVAEDYGEQGARKTIERFVRRLESTDHFESARVLDSESAKELSEADVKRLVQMLDGLSTEELEDAHEVLERLRNS